MKNEEVEKIDELPQEEELSKEEIKKEEERRIIWENNEKKRMGDFLGSEIMNLEKVSKLFMFSIQIAQGLIDRECEAEYPQKWVDKILDHLLIFYVSNPEFFFNDEVIVEMSVMGATERTKKYGKCNGWSELDKVLNEYYAFLCS